MIRKILAVMLVLLLAAAGCVLPRVLLSGADGKTAVQSLPREEIAVQSDLLSDEAFSNRLISACDLLQNRDEYSFSTYVTSQDQEWSVWQMAAEEIRVMSDAGLLPPEFPALWEQASLSPDGTELECDFINYISFGPSKQETFPFAAIGLWNGGEILLEPNRHKIVAMSFSGDLAHAVSEWVQKTPLHPALSFLDYLGLNLPASDYYPDALADELYYWEKYNSTTGSFGTALLPGTDNLAIAYLYIQEDSYVGFWPLCTGPADYTALSKK